MGDAGPNTTDPRYRALAKLVEGPWPQVFSAWEEFRGRYGSNVHADVGTNDQEGFLVDAFASAVVRGKMRQLAEMLAGAGLVKEPFEKEAAKLLPAGFQLQSYINGAFAPVPALLSGRMLLKGCDHTCKIAVGGKHSGTGVLIRPNLVATAGHVVEALVAADGTALADSLGKLEITFFDADDIGPAGEITAAPMVAELHDDWLIHFSRRAPGEGQDMPVDDFDGIDAQNGPWDLALIQLGKTPREGLHGHPIHDGPVAPVSFWLNVLHHPGNAVQRAERLLWSTGEVNDALGAPDPVRWLHTANTARGSSGAPCFNDNWRLVALHQGGSDQVEKQNQRNRAVPIYRWKDEIDAILAAAAGAGQATEDSDLVHVIDDLGNTVPVFGRGRLQRALRASMGGTVPVEQRAFFIRGESQTGKTFTGPILKALVREAGQPVITLDMHNAQVANAFTLAERIVGALGADLGPEVKPFSDLTSDLRDVRNDIAPALLAQIEIAAAGKPLWLFLDGFDSATLLAASNTPQLIETMLASLDTAPSLRMVLTGWKGPTRVGLSDTTPFLETLESAPTDEQIARHLWMLVAPAGTPPPKSWMTIVSAYAAPLLAPPAGVSPYMQAVSAVPGLKVTLEPIAHGLLQTLPAPGGPG